MEKAKASCLRNCFNKPGARQADEADPRAKLTSVRLAQRARIVLLSAQGLKNKNIAVQLGVGRVQVSRCRDRYTQAELADIERNLARGAPPATTEAARLVELTTQAKPGAATHWSTRTMAAELGISAANVSRYWRKNRLKLHVGHGLKVSRDPKFVEKLDDKVIANQPAERQTHVMLDHLRTHKRNDEWLAAHPRATFHFTPTSASWLN